MKAAKKALLFEACAGLFYADFGHCIGCIFSLMRYSDACYFFSFSLRIWTNLQVPAINRGIQFFAAHTIV